MEKSQVIHHTSTTNFIYTHSWWYYFKHNNNNKINKSMCNHKLTLSHCAPQIHQLGILSGTFPWSHCASAGFSLGIHSDHVSMCSYSLACRLSILIYHPGSIIWLAVLGSIWVCSSSAPTCPLVGHQFEL